MPYTPRTEAQKLDFYRRMYFEYVELFTSTAADAIQLASEGRWFDLIEMCADRLDARDAAQEGDAEVYELARPKAKTADAAPDLLAALKVLLACVDTTDPEDYGIIRITRQSVKGFETLVAQAEGRSS